MSLWESYKSNINFNKLDKDLEVDTLIIGGGIAGLTTLYYLKDYNKSVCLVDATKIGYGVSKNTTGKINYLQGAVYTDLEKNINRKTAINYLESQRYAIDLIKEIITKEKIDCDLESVSSNVYAMNKKEVKKLKKEKEFLESRGLKVQENNDFLYSIKVDDTYVFNSIKYLNGLLTILKNKNIYENTLINKIIFENQKYTCYFDKGKIIAKNIIVTCHYPFFSFPFFLPIKSHIEKSYLIALEVNKNLHCTGITVSNPGFSYRFYQDKNKTYLICLASSHNTALKQDDLKNFLKVKDLFKIDDKKIVAMWSNIDIITNDKLPFIGEVKNNFYLATGFNTWGMTNGVLAAKIITDAILSKQNKYQNLFNLKRNNYYKWKNLFGSIGSNVYAFLKSKKINKTWYKNNLTFKKVKGKTIAIFTDSKGIKHKVYTTCPHLKCSLVFNELEKTWDCPCHSSRFDLDGKCLKGPSTYDISFKE